MPSGYHHAGVAVDDLPAAIRFYEDALGLDRVGPDDPDATVETADYYWLRAGAGAWLNLVHRPGAVPDEAAERRLDDPHVAFAVSEDEQAAVRERLDGRGLDYEASPNSLYVRDPAGNLVEVTAWDGPE